ncbi:MAG: zinc ABC transporter substrate-binding protein, partial [Pseudomonadota bacterium]
HHALRPSEARALAEADLALWIGPELTPSLGERIETLGDARSLMLIEAPGVAELSYREGPGLETGEEDDHHGHDDHDDHADHDNHAGHDDHDDHAEHASHDEEHAGHDDHAEHASHEGHDHDEDHAGHDDDERHDDDHAGHDDHDAHADGGHDDHDAHADGGHDGHDGHDHGGRDPHVWLDPRNGQAMLSAIAEALAEIDPARAEIYRANAAAGAKEIAAAEARIAARLAPLSGQSFLVLHDAYQYFETRFGLSAAAAVALGDASDPGPRRLAAVRDLAETRGAVCIFTEPQLRASLAERVADAADLRVGQLDPHGAALEPGPDLYVALLEGLATSFESCLAQS